MTSGTPLPAVRHPTILLAQGPLGVAAARAVLDGLGDPRAPLVTLDADRPDLASAVVDAARRLMRIGQHDVAEPRLELVLLVDRLAGVGGTPLATLRTQIADALLRELPGVFPAGRPPEQRTAALHVLVAADAWVGPSALRTLDELAQLDAAPDALGLLARGWLLAAQTPHGVRTPSDLAAEAAAWVTLAFASGAREHEAVRARFAHVAADDRWGLAVAARLDLPVARLTAWGRARAAWEALDRAVDRARRSAARATPALPALDPSALLDALDASPELARLRQARPGTAEAREAWAALDVRVTEALEDAHAALRATLAGPLGDARPLDRAADLAAAVQHAADAADAALRAVLDTPRAAAGDASADRVAATPPPPALAPDDRDARAAFAATLAATLAATGALALALPWAVPAASGASLSATVVQVTGGMPPPPVPPAMWAAWGGAALAATVAGFAVRRGRADASPVRAPLSATDAPHAPAARAARLRLLRGVRAELAHADERLAVLRAALVEARDAARATFLAAAGVGAPTAPGALGTPEDEVAALLGPPGPLHDHLVDARTAAAWVRGARRYVDPDAWTDALLRAVWPPDGIREDVPGADPAAITAAAATQVEDLGHRPLLADAAALEAASARTEAFAARAARAWTPGTVPRGPHGDPVVGVRPGEVLALLPHDARGPLGDALARAQVAVAATLEGVQRTPAVVLVRTWEGLTVADLARGAQGGR
jgi:hypothetical protein